MTEKDSVQPGDGSPASIALFRLWMQDAVKACDCLYPEQSHPAEAEPMGPGGDDRNIRSEATREHRHPNARNDLADMEPNPAGAGEWEGSMLDSNTRLVDSIPPVM